MTDQDPSLEYAGFWVRAGAAAIDGVLIAVIIIPLSIAMYGDRYFTDPSLILGFGDFIIQYILPAIATIAFWHKKGATPGKMATQLQIVDATSGGPPSIKQWVIRYLAYFLSLIPFGVGYIWIAFDSKRRGWHDILANTVVVRRVFASPIPQAEPVTFDEPAQPGAAADAASPRR